MKKFVLPVIGLVASLLTVQAQTPFFTPGNLAVVRIGGTNGGASENPQTSGLGATVYIDQYTTNGTFVNTFSVPASGPNALIMSAEPYEGYLTLTPDGTHLVFAGFNTSAPYSSELIDSTSASVARVVGTLDSYGIFAMPITNNSVFNTYTCMGAASDGSNFWMAGNGGSSGYIDGAVYVGTAASGAASQVTTNLISGGMHSVNIYNNMLYACGYSSNTTITTTPYGAGGYLLSNLSGALPTAGTAFSNSFPTGTSAASDASDLVINPANTLAYVADYSFGIVKFTNNGNGWVSNYTIVLTNAGYTQTGGKYAISVTADFSRVNASLNNAIVYATTDESYSNRLVRLQDTGTAAGANATVVNLAANTLVSGSGGYTNTFRGVRFVPGYPVVITNGPASLLVDAGQVATFSVGASGTPTLFYQWYSNSPANPTFVPIPSATNSSFTLADTMVTQSNSMFYVTVSNYFGLVQSTNAALFVAPPGPPANIQVTPANQTINAGSVAVFNASFVGATNSLSYGWSLNGTPLTNGALGLSTISGATTLTLTISNAFAIDDGSYEALITNSLGHNSGGPGLLQVNDPAIITNVMGVTNIPGSGPLELSVSAVGTGLTYQWYSNGVAISAANSSSYNVPNSASISSASYFVVISNSLGASVTNGPTIVSYTPLILNETFPYPNGNLFGDAGSPWVDINGTNAQLVTNNRAVINQSNATTDAQSLFSQPEGNDVMWASFIVHVTCLPTNAGGVYFANIEDTNFNFFGRIFCLISNQPGFTPNIPNVAFNGTYRLGIADAQGDSAGTSKTGPNAVVPLDLAPGIDYQVVFYVDFGNQVSGMAINPASSADVTAQNPGGVSSGPATDAFTSGENYYTNQLMNAFGMRQRQGVGVLEIGDIKVSFDWNGAGSGYAAVTAGVTAAAPVIGLQPVGTTNYSGNPFTMEVAASGIGAAGTGLTYSWYQNSNKLSDGGNITGSATPALSIAALDPTNAGTYYVTVKGAAATTVQSSNTVISVNTTATAPTFTVQPAAYTTNSEGGTVTLDSLAVGTGPITYAWYSVIDGSTNPAGSGADLTLSGLNTNESGTYYVIATGGTGLQTQSSNGVLIVNGPKSVTIGYLRSLLNPTTYQPSDTSTLFTINGVITTATNQTTGNTASYYIQDSTGGINLFVTLGSDFRPALGDLVTATGILSSYEDNYELDVTEGAADYVDTILGTGSPLPTPILFPWGYTAPLPANIATNVEGSVVMLTNLYFEAYVPGSTNNFFTTNTQQYVVTNQTGLSYTIFTSDQDTNFVAGQPLPAYAYSIAGPLIQVDTTVGVFFTVYSNLVLTAPVLPTAPPTSPTAALTGTPGSRTVTLSWTAVPSDTYHIITATNLLGPWATVASGLSFGTTNGTYTDTAPTNTALFYEIVSP